MSDISHGFRIKSEEHCAFSYFSVRNTERRERVSSSLRQRVAEREREREMVYELVVLIKFKLVI